MVSFETTWLDRCQRLLWWTVSAVNRESCLPESTYRVVSFPRVSTIDTSGQVTAPRLGEFCNYLTSERAIRGIFWGDRGLRHSTAVYGYDDNSTDVSTDSAQYFCTLHRAPTIIGALSTRVDEYNAARSASLCADAFPCCFCCCCNTSIKSASTNKSIFQGSPVDRFSVQSICTVGRTYRALSHFFLFPRRYIGRLWRREEYKIRRDKVIGWSEEKKYVQKEHNFWINFVSYYSTIFSLIFIEEGNSIIL